MQQANDEVADIGAADGDDMLSFADENAMLYSEEPQQTTGRRDDGNELDEGYELENQCLEAVCREDKVLIAVSDQL